MEILAKHTPSVSNMENRVKPKGLFQIIKEAEAIKVTERQYLEANLSTSAHSNIYTVTNMDGSTTILDIDFTQETRGVFNPIGFSCYCRRQYETDEHWDECEFHRECLRLLQSEEPYDLGRFAVDRHMHNANKSITRVRKPFAVECACPRGYNHLSTCLPSYVCHCAFLDSRKPQHWDGCEAAAWKNIASKFTTLVRQKEVIERQRQEDLAAQRKATINQSIERASAAFCDALYDFSQHRHNSAITMTMRRTQDWVVAEGRAQRNHSSLKTASDLAPAQNATLALVNVLESPVHPVTSFYNSPSTSSSSSGGESSIPASTCPASTPQQDQEELDNESPYRSLFTGLSSPPLRRNPFLADNSSPRALRHNGIELHHQCESLRSQERSTNEEDFPIIEPVLMDPTVSPQAEGVEI